MGFGGVVEKVSGANFSVDLPSSLPSFLLACGMLSMHGPRPGGRRRRRRERWRPGPAADAGGGDGASWMGWHGQGVAAHSAPVFWFVVCDTVCRL